MREEIGYDRHGIGTTAGNRLRELSVEIMQAQAKAAGIEFRPDNQPSRLFFPRIAEENYDIALFAWVGNLVKSSSYANYASPDAGGSSHYANYSNKTMDAKYQEANQNLDFPSRVKQLNEVDKLIAAHSAGISTGLADGPGYHVFGSRSKSPLASSSSA